MRWTAESGRELQKIMMDGGRQLIEKENILRLSDVAPNPQGWIGVKSNLKVIADM